jgi:hypothetical protein
MKATIEHQLLRSGSLHFSVRLAAASQLMQQAIPNSGISCGAIRGWRLKGALFWVVFLWVLHGPG